MGCSRSQAPMRLFLCIFDKVFWVGGVISTSHTPEQSPNLDVNPHKVELRQRLIRGVI